MVTLSYVLVGKILTKHFPGISWKIGDLPNKFMIMGKKITGKTFQFINWLFLSLHDEVQTEKKESGDCSVCKQNLEEIGSRTCLFGK